LRASSTKLQGEIRARISKAVPYVRRLIAIHERARDNAAVGSARHSLTGKSASFILATLHKSAKKPGPLRVNELLFA
jgi:hypothetical protein